MNTDPLAQIQTFPEYCRFYLPALVSPKSCPWFFFSWQNDEKNDNNNCYQTETGGYFSN